MKRLVLTFWTYASIVCLVLGGIELFFRLLDGSSTMPLWLAAVLTICGAVSYAFAPSLPVSCGKKK